MARVVFVVDVWVLLARTNVVVVVLHNLNGLDHQIFREVRVILRHLSLDKFRANVLGVVVDDQASE